MTTTRFESIRLKAMCVALFAVYPVLAEAGIAGRVQFVAGDVRVVDAGGKTAPLVKGQDVNEGDTLLSGANGSAQLRMIDGAIVAVRPGTEVKVIDYVFNDAEDGKETANLSLVKGGLRAITGAIGKISKDKVKIATPTATIGIRGTDHEPAVILPALAGAPTIAPPGTYDKVNIGATSLTTNVGTTVIAANQVGFAASPTQPPVILPKMPDFYRATPAPTQQAQQEQKQEQTQSSATPEEKPAAAAAPAAASTEPAEVIAPPPATNLTAVDAGGNTLNVASQTLTSSTGQTQTLSGDTVVTPPPPTPVQTTAYSGVIAAYPASSASQTGGQTFSYPAVYSFFGPDSALSRDASGNLTGVTSSGTEHFGYRSTLSQTGSTMTNLGQHAAAGLSWGRWQGGQVTHATQYLGVDATGNVGIGAYNDLGVFVIGGAYTNSATLGTSSLHWIAGTHTGPEYLSHVLTGSATYTLVGGTSPTDQNGNVGTLNSAGLSVNFTNQLASANVNFSIGGNNWTMASNDMTLDDAYFNSYSGCSGTPCSSNLNITRNGAPVSSTATTTGTFAFGSMNGSLTGASLNGAALQYAVQEGGVVSTGTTTTFTNNVIQGVAALSGPAQDVNTPFRAVGAVDGWNAGGDFGTDFVEWDAPGVFRGAIDGGEAPAARVVVGSSGLTEFMGSASEFTTTANTVADFDIPATIKIGTAANRDVGSVTIGGATITWGRWEGGSIDIYSRDGSVKLGTIDNSGRSVHWIATPVLTSAAAFTNLPLTGTATYSVAGNTNPTDFLGNVGTLTSATLTADFGAQKVNAGVNVSFNSPTNTSNWTMTANNVPIKGRDGFESGTPLNGLSGITHTASCTGNPCGAQTIGQLGGVFFSEAQGAVVTYGMATGSITKAPSSSTFAPVNGVSGLVVMKR